MQMKYHLLRSCKTSFRRFFSRYIPVRAFTFWTYFWPFFTPSDPFMFASLAFAFQYGNLLDCHQSENL